MREYGFELRLCAHLETVTDAIVARQIGGGCYDRGGRVLDVVMIEPGPAFEQRTAITSETIPPRAIFSHVGVGRARSWPHATDLSGETATRLLERALDVGFFEHVHHDGPTRVRQTARYPDWIGSITAIENKPDLGSPGDLADQLRHDVALGIVDRVILATSSHVTGAHLNRLPAAVGIWQVNTTSEGMAIEEMRAPNMLDPTDWGIEIGDRVPLHRDIRAVSPEEKQRARIRLAERAYGKGWRPSFPACSQAIPEATMETDAIPFCRWKDRVVDPGRCGPNCPGFDPESPPATDHRQERAERTQWDPDPAGFVRRQAGLAAFTEMEEDA